MRGYGRRRFGRRRVGKRYSSETYGFAASIPATTTQNTAVLVGATEVKGMRKVKNFRLTITSDVDVPCAWALVYVPEGLSASTLAVGTADNPASLYEPNQNVIMSGWIAPNPGNAQTFTTRLARILNSGDKIVFCFRPTQGGSEGKNIICSLNYAIAY